MLLFACVARQQDSKKLRRTHVAISCQLRFVKESRLNSVSNVTNLINYRLLLITLLLGSPIKRRKTICCILASVSR